MADELTLRVSLSFEKSDTIMELLFGPAPIEVAGTKPLRNRQSIGFAAEEAIVVGDAAAGGYFAAVNRDATNFVELRPGAGLADLIKLLPGDVCLFRLTGDATLYAIANTAAVELEYVILPL